MPLLQTVRPLMAGVLAIMILTMAGCPTTAETQAIKEPQARTSKKLATDESPPVRLPVAEFQQPPLLPPSEPLAKPAIEPVEPPTMPPMPSATAKPPRAANPLRNDSPAPAKQPLADASKQAELPLRGKPKTGKNSGKPFDPEKENGKIFVDWPKPKVALVLTGMEEGYIEPCGCAGMDRMKGGMSRRATFLKELREKGWPVVALDVGGLVHGFGRQAELKFQTAIEGKRKMGYDAVALGFDELRLPTGELIAAGVADDKPSLFVDANVGLIGLDQLYTAKMRIIEAGGRKIGVTGILGKTYRKEVNNNEIETVDAEAALAKIVPELKAKADFLVLLAHATRDESIALGKKFPAFDVVVCSDGAPEPPRDLDGLPPEVIPGTKTPLITVGYKGMNAITLGLFNDAERPLRYQRVPLDSRFPSSPEMKMLMAAYQDQLKIIGFAGLGLRPVPHPLLETNGRFIGSQKCESCHEKSYDIWKKTNHGHAYATIEKLDPPRNYDPECVSCHVTGWNPGRFFPYVSGYESKEKTPALINTGCENCHGPGEKHANAELGANEELQKKLRKAMVITKAESEKQQCFTCHDLDNSPEFKFELYWPYIRHYEKEE